MLVDKSVVMIWTNVQLLAGFGKCQTLFSDSLDCFSFEFHRKNTTGDALHDFS
jgi:hypothetical protein